MILSSIESKYTNLSYVFRDAIPKMNLLHEIRSNKIQIVKIKLKLNTMYLKIIV